MSNSQCQRREIITLDEFPRSSTPEPAPKRQRTSRMTSRTIINIPTESRPRVTRSAGTVETTEPPRVMDSAERSSDPLGYQAATPAWDPQEAAVEDAYGSPSRVMDSSERLSRRIAHCWQRLGYYLKFRPRRGSRQEQCQRWIWSKQHGTHL